MKRELSSIVALLAIAVVGSAASTHGGVAARDALLGMAFATIIVAATYMRGRSSPAGRAAAANEDPAKSTGGGAGAGAGAGAGGAAAASAAAGSGSASTTVPRVPVAFDVDPTFKREEMGTAELAGSVKRYDTHLFVSTGDPSTWPARVEETPVIARLSDAKGRAGRPIRITACFPYFVGKALTKLTGANAALVFPDRVGYRSVDTETADRIIDEHLAGGQLVGAARPIPLQWDGFFIFVCCHKARDARCGACGPQLLRQFKACVQAAGLENKVHLFGCSHIGGHAYAGNVVAFGRKRDCGQTIGDWFGYVTPDRCAELLDGLLHDRVIPSLWRGQMGTDPEQHKTMAAAAVSAAAVPMESCGPGCKCVPTPSA